MSEKKNTPFKSSTTDYAAIRKRMVELGIGKPEEKKPFVAPVAPVYEDDIDDAWDGIYGGG